MLDRIVAGASRIDHFSSPRKLLSIAQNAKRPIRLTLFDDLQGLVEQRVAFDPRMLTQHDYIDYGYMKTTHPEVLVWNGAHNDGTKVKLFGSWKQATTWKATPRFYVCQLGVFLPPIGWCEPFRKEQKSPLLRFSNFSPPNGQANLLSAIGIRELPTVANEVGDETSPHIFWERLEQGPVRIFFS